MNGKRALTSVWIAIIVLAPLVGLAAAEGPEPDQLQAPADFNGDWFADLAIGVPFEDIGDPAAGDAGAVNILYGGRGAGLSTRNNRTLSQNDAGVAGDSETDDRFGNRLAVGDFNGDGYYDLAVGVCGEHVGTIVDAGAVHIFYGSAAGLTVTGNQVWDQESPGIQGEAEINDVFGGALAAGDFNGDSYADLAVGVFLEDIGDPVISEAGVVQVIYGSAAGLTSAGNQLWHQDSADMAGNAEVWDQFGKALAAADFNGDGRADLAMGVPVEAIGDPVIANAGVVQVIYGSAAGLTSAGNQLWHQDSPDVAGNAEPGDQFGNALAAADFNGDGRADLAVGVGPEDVGTIVDAGAVNVLYGSAAGLTATGNQLWDQESPGIQGEAENGDFFGHALAAGDFNGDGRADLAVGVPWEDIGDPVISDAGVVQVIYGSAAGLTNAGNQLWHQDSPDMAGNAEAADAFGYALAAIPRTTHGVYLPVILR